MKRTVLAAAALTGGATARFSNHRHLHDLLKRGYEGEVCTPGCTTIYSTIYGEPTRMGSLSIGWGV